ncbi:MAG: DUF4339 domain-containing protein [Polyangiaceae bacterium]
MNVACTACPAKYAVPDERVRGKRVRITCKHCGTFIVVDGTSLGASGSQVAPLPTAAANNARERRKTMLGIGNVPGGAAAGAAAALGVPLASSPRASRPPEPEAANHAWLVALGDGRREPASLARIVDLFSSGSIDSSTYIWREGMTDWKKPFEIPEIAAALKARGIGGASGLSMPPPDPDEATRVSLAPTDDLLKAPSPAPAPPRPPSAQPGTSSKFDDDGVTVARTGPPSAPFTAAPPPAAGTPAVAPGRQRPTLPPLGPSAARPPGRPRQSTIPPLGGVLARPPSRVTNPQNHRAATGAVVGVERSAPTATSAAAGPISSAAPASSCALLAGCVGVRSLGHSSRQRAAGRAGSVRSAARTGSGASLGPARRAAARRRSVSPQAQQRQARGGWRHRCGRLGRRCFHILRTPPATASAAAHCRRAHRAGAHACCRAHAHREPVARS